MSADDANTTISFRLPTALHDEVVRLAEASGITKHQLARTLIVRALESGERPSSEIDLFRCRRCVRNPSRIAGRFSSGVRSWHWAQSCKTSLQRVTKKKSGGLGVGANHHAVNPTGRG